MTPHARAPNPWGQLDLPLGRHSYSVIGVCELIHGAYCGSGDPIREDMLHALIVWLTVRVADWTESANPACRDYDNAVKKLVVATLLEAGELQRKEGTQ